MGPCSTSPAASSFERFPASGFRPPGNLSPQSPSSARSCPPGLRRNAVPPSKPMRLIPAGAIAFRNRVAPHTTTSPSFPGWSLHCSVDERARPRRLHGPLSPALSLGDAGREQAKGQLNDGKPAAQTPFKVAQRGGCLSSPHPLPSLGFRAERGAPPAGADSRGHGNWAGGGEGIPGGWGGKAPPIPHIFHPLSATVVHGSGCCQRRGAQGVRRAGITRRARRYPRHRHGAEDQPFWRGEKMGLGLKGRVAIVTGLPADWVSQPPGCSRSKVQTSSCAHAQSESRRRRRRSDPRLRRGCSPCGLT